MDHWGDKDWLKTRKDLIRERNDYRSLHGKTASRLHEARAEIGRLKYELADVRALATHFYTELNQIKKKAEEVMSGFTRTYL